MHKVVKELDTLGDQTTTTKGIMIIYVKRKAALFGICYLLWKKCFRKQDLMVKKNHQSQEK